MNPKDYQRMRNRGRKSLEKFSIRNLLPSRFMKNFMPGIFNGIPFGARQSFFYESRYIVLGGFAGGIYQWLAYYLKLSLGASRTQVSVFTSFRYLGLIIAVLVPLIFQIKSKKKIFLFCIFASALMHLFLPFVFDLWLFIILAGITNAVAVISVPMRFGIIRVNYPVQKRGDIISRFAVRRIVILVIMYFYASMVLEYKPDYFRVLLFLAAVAGFMGFCIYSRVRVRGEDPKSLAKAQPVITIEKILRVSKNIRFLLYMLILISASFIYAMVGRLYITFMTENINPGFIWLAIIGPWGPFRRGAEAISVRLFWGKFIDRNPIPMQARAIIYFLWGITPIIYFFTYDVWLLCFTSIILGLGLGLANLNSTLVQMYFVPKEDVPACVLVSRMLQAFGGFAAQFLAISLLAYMDIRVAFLVLSGGVLFFAFLFYVYYLIEKRMRPHATGNAEGAD